MSKTPYRFLLEIAESAQDQITELRNETDIAREQALAILIQCQNNLPFDSNPLIKSLTFSDGVIKQLSWTLDTLNNTLFFLSEGFSLEKAWAEACRLVQMREFAD